MGKTILSIAAVFVEMSGTLSDFRGFRAVLEVERYVFDGGLI